MKSRIVAGLFTAFFIVAGLTGLAMGQTNGYTVSEPISYKNLSIFLIHGKDENTKGNILTLQEAMERNLFVVYETGSVNELMVENLSKEFDVFIQSGDIVKGGRQDRVLAVSIIIPARSGKVSIEAFCVESGRWTKRGNEESDKFTSSNDRIVTKELKIAANGERSQTEVWKQVSEAQARLGKSVGGTVNSPKSESSLQLSLENREVVANIDEYMKRLGSAIDGKSDVIGYAFSINGQINSADIYVSNALFKKLWPKLIQSSAVEATSEKKEGLVNMNATEADVFRCISNADAAKPFGQPRRSRDIDEQHETVLLDRRMIASGDEIQQRTRADQVGDAEHQIHQHREHG